MGDPIGEDETEPGTLTASHAGLALGGLSALDSSRYAVEREVARGGAGRILAATDRHLGRAVALKRALEPAGESRLAREARLASRLQHPSIVPVFDAGFDAEGRTVIAMKLVEGRSLREVIAGTRTLRERLAVLPTVVAVAEAIAYAHSRGIIHRDLKPANVLVGAYGETAVIDWGLAKALRGPAEAGGGSGAMVGDVDMTRTGAIMGTPGYMAPEQARGEPVDERADVYAIGAVLYHLLAGAPPFEKLPDTDVMTEVATRAPMPLDQRAPGIPRDLATIVAKAMARDPADRYRTAAPLAEDLRAFQTGQLVSAHEYSLAALVGRFLRRHRAPVAIAAAAIVALAVVGAVTAARIVHERDRAERQRAGAEDLAEFMMSDLRDRLDAIGRLDALRGVGEKVEGYYHQTSSDGLDDAAIRRRARAIRLAALVRRDAGDLEGERAGLDAALRQHAALRGAQPAEEAIERVALLLDRGELEIQENHIDAALADQEKARALAAETVARERSAVTQSALIDAENGLGGTYDREARYDQARDHFRAAYDLEQALLASEPGDGPVGHKQALTARRLGRVLALLGRYDEGEAMLRAATDAAKAVVARHPNDAAWLRELAGGAYTLGGVGAKAGHIQEALAAYDIAVDAGRRLVARDDSNTSWAFNFVQVLDQASEAWRDVNQLYKALALLDEAKQQCDRLVAHDPKNRIWRHEQANIATVRAKAIAQDRRAPEEVVALHSTAVSILEQLVAEEPHNGMFVRRLGDSHTDLSAALLEVKRIDDAQREADAAIRILDAASAAGADDFDMKYRRSLATAARVEVEEARGQIAAAEADARKLLAFDEGMYDAKAPIAEVRIALVRDHNYLGRFAARDPRRAGEARDHLGRALTELDGIQRDGQWSTSFEEERRKAKAVLAELPAVKRGR